MARGGGDRGDNRRRSPKDSGRRTAKKKVCIFCSEHIQWVDYKDVNLLRRFMSDRGKIRARRVSGNCAQHQRDVAVAIKTARELAMLPYTQRTVAERGGGRGRRDDREDREDRVLRADAVAGNGEIEVPGIEDLGDEAIVTGESPGGAEPDEATAIAEGEAAMDADADAGSDE